jgi:hypothetical protein
MRKILLITTRFYDYYKIIGAEIEHMGYNFEFIDILPVSLRRLMFFLPPKIMILYNERRIMHRLKCLKLEEFDILLVIKGEFFKKTLLDYIRKRNSYMRFVLYQWDSVALFDYRELAHEFDSVTTFDPVDANQNGYNYLPLFYTRDIKPVESIQENIDIFFIGKYYPARMKALQHFREISQRHKLNFYHHIYCPFTLYLNLLLHGHAPKFTDVKLRPMKRPKLISMYHRSKVFLDIITSKQNGFSMRTIECYGMNKKIISSNVAIETDPILQEMAYQSANASEENIVHFIKTPKVYYKYKDNLSVERWIVQLIQNI